MSEDRDNTLRWPEVADQLRSALQVALSTLEQARIAYDAADDDQLGTDLISAILKAVKERDKTFGNDFEPDALRVMVSWSGKQSKRIAETLRQWLESVLPGLEVWVSSEDIVIGKRWFTELMDVLETTNVCIICVTEENVDAPWIHYEAGAIAARGRALDQEPLICPFLTDVDVNRISGTPLAQFQCVQSTKDGTWKLMRLLNSSLRIPHNDDLLQAAFRSKWRSFKEQLKAMGERKQTAK